MTFVLNQIMNVLRKRERGYGKITMIVGCGDKCDMQRERKRIMSYIQICSSQPLSSFLSQFNGFSEFCMWWNATSHLPPPPSLWFQSTFDAVCHDKLDFQIWFTSIWKRSLLHSASRYANIQILLLRCIIVNPVNNSKRKPREQSSFSWYNIFAQTTNRYSLESRQFFA